jgi:hypothetical protein
MVCLPKAVASLGCRVAREGHFEAFGARLSRPGPFCRPDQRPRLAPTEDVIMRNSLLRYAEVLGQKCEEDHSR